MMTMIYNFGFVHFVRNCVHQVRTAPEAERALRAVEKAKRDAGGNTIARKPLLRRSAHTLTVRFWSDESPLGARRLAAIAVTAERRG